MAEVPDLKNLTNLQLDSNIGQNQFENSFKSEFSSTTYKDNTDTLTRKEKDDIINQLLEKYGAKTKIVDVNRSTDLLGASSSNYNASLDSSIRKSQLIQNVQAINEPKFELATSQYLPPYQNWNERFEYDKHPPFQTSKTENNSPGFLGQNHDINSQSSSPSRFLSSSQLKGIGNLIYERNPLVEQIIREEKEKKALAELKNSSYFSSSLNDSPASIPKPEKINENLILGKNESNLLKQRSVNLSQKVDNYEYQTKLVKNAESAKLIKSTSTDKIVTPPSGKNGFKIVGVLILILIFRLFIILYLDI